MILRGFRNAFSFSPRWTAAAVLAFLLFAGAPAFADHHVNTSSGLTISGAPLALHGYDAVAYFTGGRAIRGKAEFTATHDGAAYRFTSAEHKARFEESPERYLPEYGGFCAFGVAKGAKFDGDPEVFRIVDGKLYLNLNPAIQKEWAKDVPGNISTADGNWKIIRDKAPSMLK